VSGHEHFQSDGSAVGRLFLSWISCLLKDGESGSWAKQGGSSIWRVQCVRRYHSWVRVIFHDMQVISRAHGRSPNLPFNMDRSGLTWGL
jgi:hypothetical protein